MTYLYTDEQKQIREEVSRAVAATCSPDTLRELLERKGEYDTAFWSTAKEMGWSALSIPEDMGGLGLGLIDAMIVAEECGRGLAGAPFLATNFAAQLALELAGGQDALLGEIAAGDKTATLAFAEGSEILPVRPGVKLKDGKVSGQKRAILGGAVADVAIVLAAGAPGALSIAIVDLNDTSVERTPLDTIDNSRCTADLHFNNTPATTIACDDAAALARQCLARLALHLSSEAVGGADTCIKKASEYANERQAFGQAIGKFQGVKHAISEMWVLNEMARASVLDAAGRLARGEADAEAYVAAARLNAVEAYDTAAAGSTQVHGGIGVTWEADLHLHYRRARTLAGEAGAAHLWEDIITGILESAA